MDGPFAETKEALGGFYLIEAATKEEAVEWGKEDPAHGRRLHRRGPRLGDVTPNAAFEAALTEAFRLEYGRVVASVLRIVQRHRHGGGARPGGLRPGPHQLARGRDGRSGRAPGSSRRRGVEPSIISAGGRRAEAHAEALGYESGLGATDEIPDVTDPETIADDRLRLIFTCCHPGLPAESRVALTLRLVGGFSTTEIARAFLVPEPTIAQRLVRAKRTIRDRGFRRTRCRTATELPSVFRRCSRCST